MTVQAQQVQSAIVSKQQLGELLFNDRNLSLNRQQSCASCHNPAAAFIDSRVDEKGNRLMTSLGTDNKSIGGRNTPTVTYAVFTPSFDLQGAHSRFNSQQSDYHGPVGGMFLDGREAGLAEQAGQPPLNPLEMQMPSKQKVVERLQENRLYREAFNRFYGSNVFAQTDNAYWAMTDAIAEFEKSPEVSSFDAKYDRVLRGEEEFSFKELSGKSLFFSQQFTNCATCHQGHANGYDKETFSNYEYHNIGVPKNADLAKLQLQANGVSQQDHGLLDNPAVNSGAHLGQFKVPTLRNVAVSAPYMHNGVFQDLSTVIKFYDHFLLGSKHKINPETGKPWLDPEFAETVSWQELKDGRKLKPFQVEQMVCFLRTLTDKRYEHLIEKNGIECAD
ncbi:methylamine utilization protein MauG [Thiomicrorhabdus sediminis]|uniref:Methylamine utilization protein MauG n=2 Tax=Thiomicrorhabdus sediminis TaxID=2580412 RepID=A0A4P9K7G4_9GAMM|nr:methylamine utilization protein MauG [Thiomicrorhabdus sediminis]